MKYFRAAAKTRFYCRRWSIGNTEERAAAGRTREANLYWCVRTVIEMGSAGFRTPTLSVGLAVLVEVGAAAAGGVDASNMVRRR